MRRMREQWPQKGCDDRRDQADFAAAIGEAVFARRFAAFMHEGTSGQRA